MFEGKNPSTAESAAGIAAGRQQEAYIAAGRQQEAYLLLLVGSLQAACLYALLPSKFLMKYSLAVLNSSLMNPSLSIQHRNA